jgi:hypothetical protein
MTKTPNSPKNSIWTSVLDFSILDFEIVSVRGAAFDIRVSDFDSELRGVLARVNPRLGRLRAAE